MKKFLLKAYSFLFYLFKGLHRADEIVMGDKESALSPDASIEQQQEQDSVWQDLLKGELTERVKTLRYSTAHASRESKNYEFVSGTLGAKKRSGLLDFKGSVSRNDDEVIILVQDNNRTTAFKDEKNGGKDYIIRFIYDFIPKINLSSYVTKLVIKENTNGFKVIDFYFSKYLERYNNVHKFFKAEIERIMNGNWRSQILETNSVRFETFNAFGEHDGVTCLVEGLKFIGTDEFDGSYILRYTYDRLIKDDFIHTVYDENAEKKYLNKEKRDGFVHNISFDLDKQAKEEEEKEYNEKLSELLRNEGI